MLRTGFRAIVLASVVVLFPATASAFGLDLGLGVKGGVNGNVVDGVPEDQTFEYQGGLYQDPDIYAMFGIGGGIGATIEARAMDMVGLETGFYLSYDNGDGWEDQTGPGGRKLGRIDQEQRTTAFHVPILLKAVVPGMVRPAFGLGTEIVIQSESSLQYSSKEVINIDQFNAERDITTSTYVMLMATIGMEFDLDVVRIPLEIRLGYNTQFFGNDIDDRLEPSDDVILYDGEYQGYFAIFTGIVYEFDFIL